MPRFLKPLFTALTLAFFLAAASEARADRISGVTVTTNMGAGFGTNIINTVNGVGLSSPTLTATHAASLPANSWVSSPSVLTGQITFNLGGLFSVDSFSFWNQNGGGPGVAGSTGIQGVQVLFSTNGVAFTPLPGGPSVFARATGLTSPPQIFSFTAVNATHFRFNVLSNYGTLFKRGLPKWASIAFLVLLSPSRRRCSCSAQAWPASWRRFADGVKSSLRLTLN